MLGMKYLKNDMAFFYCAEAVLPSISRFCLLIKDYPFILKPFSGNDEKVKNTLSKKQDTIGLQINNHLSDLFERIPIFSIEGFYLYPTVKKTTLFYDHTTDCFFKILHPLTVKNKILSIFTNKARSVYNLSEKLLSNGVNVPEILAYGVFKKGRRAFFIMKRVEGNSLHYILIKKKETLPHEVYRKVIDEIIKLHTMGYWFRDLRLSHVFIKNSEISGLIDIDSIRKNRPFRISNLAKDLAGLNHPDLPLTKSEKMDIFDYYMSKVNMKKRPQFLPLVKLYTERRWKYRTQNYNTQ